MPELPEVETIRRTLESVFLNRKIVAVELQEDEILLSKRPAAPFREAMLGATVSKIGRRGKFWWIELLDGPVIFGHLGMSGWIREIGAPTIRLREHGNAPMEDENGRPRFLRLLLTSAEGRSIAFTDGRRLGRIWMGDSPDTDLRVKKLGRDCFYDLPTVDEIHQMVKKRKAPIKALLMDQTVLCGIGNWIADEVLYQAAISPLRPANTLNIEEVSLFRQRIQEVIKLAIDVGCESSLYPDHWLFHSRWGGAKGTSIINGEEIVREPVGGRTTAWVPSVQK